MDLNQIQSNPSINLILLEKFAIHPFMTFTSIHLCKHIIFILLIDWYLLGPAFDALLMFFNTFGSVRESLMNVSMKMVLFFLVVTLYGY